MGFYTSPAKDGRMSFTEGINGSTRFPSIDIVGPRSPRSGWTVARGITIRWTYLWIADCGVIATLIRNG